MQNLSKIMNLFYKGASDSPTGLIFKSVVQHMKKQIKGHGILSILVRRSSNIKRDFYRYLATLPQLSTETGMSNVRVAMEHNYRDLDHYWTF